jgi:molybdenum cofactor cytidylyltransferase
MDATGTMGLGAVVLAAGQSARMGRPKALLPIGGRTLVERMVTTLRAGGVNPVVVVTAEETAAEVAKAIRDDARVVVNHQAGRGQLSSLQAGLRALPDAVPGALFTPVDLPLLQTATVTALVGAWRAADAALVRPLRSGRHGHPVVVGRPAIRALLAADVASTARAVLEAFAGETLDIAVEDDGAFRDVDTMEQYLEVLDASDVEKWKK